MTEVVALIPEPDAERDEKIFKDWRTGKKTIQKLARDYNLPQTQITAIIDQYLPSLTPVAQVRELRRLLFDLEELRANYHGIAMGENDAEAANVSIRTAHEIAQLRMFIGGGQHIDPVQLVKQIDPKHKSGPDRILEALERLAKSDVASPELQEKVLALRKAREERELNPDPDPEAA
jgi:hypothetical protein